MTMMNEDERDRSLPLAMPNDASYTYPASVLDDKRIQSQFESSVIHPALIVPARRTAELRRVLSHALMHRPKLKDVYPLEDGDVRDGVERSLERKLVLKLHDDTTSGDDANDIYSDAIVQKLLEAKDTTIRKSTHAVRLGYEHYTVEQVLRRLLPEEEVKEIPSAFEVVGHLAHLNLREEQLPFRYLIGRVILEKNKSLKIVVNKVGTISNEFRTFPMELLATAANSNGNANANSDGQGLEGASLGSICNRLEVRVREDGCQFQLDFANVYWNSRLQFEHRRLVRLIAGADPARRIHTKPKSKRNKSSKHHDAPLPIENPPLDTIVVADACAGIGPFAIPLTSQYRNITVHANDLNPVSFRYLNQNAKINNLASSSTLQTYNMDARLFLRHLDQSGVQYDHVLMNLPAIAPEFLNVFRGWTPPPPLPIKLPSASTKPAIPIPKRPMIHIHCFGGKGETADAEAIQRCERSLGCPIRDDVSVHVVRDVSPKKNMLCVSFRLPEAVAALTRVETFSDDFEEDDNDSKDVVGDEDGQENVTVVNHVEQEPLSKKPRT